MLRFATVAAFMSAMAFGSVHSLEKGEYYKPSVDEASGVLGTTAAYRRSPCPALNSLANHGYLPRNGQNVTKTGLKDAIMSVYNMGWAAATVQVDAVPDTFSLDYLSTHNMIEHDASLVHADVYYGFDPMAVNSTLAEELFARADDQGMITTRAVAQARKDLAALCESENPQCELGFNEKKNAFLQASLLLLALGEGDAISVGHARSFLVDERIPSDYVKASSPVSVLALAAKTVVLLAESL
ncbi:hypothetical protein BBJ28_00003028 [Nothophytophthora sp. Chile5]|nr:hypothetical protein BBJ28_00003028 [Nothophytophthora sp. Chile5]